MSYQHFIKELQSNADGCLDAIADEHHFFLESDSLIKQAADDEESIKRGRLAQSKYGLSDGEFEMAVKIAQEVEQLTHTLRMQSVTDPDYLFLMKKAGVALSGNAQPEITEVIDRTLTKVASGQPLNPLEELYTLSDSFQKIAASVQMSGQTKQAGVGDWVIRQGLRMGGKPVEKVVTKKPWFGSIGSYATAAAPIAAGGAYLSGRASGAKHKEQEIANELAEKLRYEANKRQAEVQGQF